MMRRGAPAPAEVGSGQGSTHELILKANAEGRIFVTRNTRLPHQYPPGKPRHPADRTDPVKQLRALAANSHSKWRAALFSAMYPLQRRFAYSAGQGIDP